jgi:hypothetical protein
VAGSEYGGWDYVHTAHSALSVAHQYNNITYLNSKLEKPLRELFPYSLSARTGARRVRELGEYGSSESTGAQRVRALREYGRLENTGITPVGACLDNRSNYGGRSRKRFLLPIWEKRGFERQDPTKIYSINSIEAFDTSISSI